MGSTVPLNDNGIDDQASWAARFLDAAQSFNQVYTPLLCLFGALGNSLSVTVFCRTSTHRSLSASFYLSALAISDTGFLLNLLAVWLEDMGVPVITTSVTCPLVMYLGQVTCFLSVWFIVAFTMERFFAVCYPLTRPTVCTVARAKKVIGILTVFALTGFSYVWIIATVLDYPVERSFLTTTSPYNDEDGGGGGGDESSHIISDTGAPIVFPPGLSLNSSLKHLRNGTATSESLTRSSSTTAEMNGTVMSSNSSSTIPSIFIEYITYCSVRQEHVYFSSIASHIDSVLTLILPFAIISYLNVRIALCVWRLKDQREHLVAMAKLTRKTTTATTTGGSHNYGGVTTTVTAPSAPPSNSAASPSSTVGYVYRSKSGHLSPNVARYKSNVYNNSSTTTHQLGSTNPNNCRSQSNLTVDFEPSESSSTSVSAHCCSEFSRRKKLQSSSNNNRRRVRKRRVNGSSHAKAETRVTKTLLLVSTVFLVLNLPAHAIRATTFIQSFWSINIRQEALFAAQLWSNILFNMNFSVNFLLYCVSGRNFRLSVKNIFCRRSRGQRHPKYCKPAGSPTTFGNHSTMESHPLGRIRKESFYPVSVTEMETYA